ncbi:MAG: thioredoxin family protein [Acutalibacteraceae bacterium]|jgi:thioredoxin 1
MKNNSSKKALQIVIPILIVVLVAGIWGVKKLQKEDSPVASGTNPDFALDFTGDNLDVEKLKSYGLPIIIEFGATWCPPCKQMAPILKELNSELQNKAIILSVDTDRNPQSSRKYNFQYIPTQIFINADGTPYLPSDSGKYNIEPVYGAGGNLLYSTHTGVLSKNDMLEMLAEMGMK